MRSRGRPLETKNKLGTAHATNASHLRCAAGLPRQRLLLLALIGFFLLSRRGPSKQNQTSHRFARDGTLRPMRSHAQRLDYSPTTGTPSDTKQSPQASPSRLRAGLGYIYGMQPFENARGSWDPTTAGRVTARSAPLLCRRTYRTHMIQMDVRPAHVQKGKGVRTSESRRLKIRGLRLLANDTYRPAFHASYVQKRMGKQGTREPT